jgi:hypothetical protein
VRGHGRDGKGSHGLIPSREARAMDAIAMAAVGQAAAEFYERLYT